MQVLTQGIPKKNVKDKSRRYGMNPATNLIKNKEELKSLAEYVKSLNDG